MNDIFWQDKYEALRAKALEFIDGKINSVDFKKIAAPLGIYEQKDGKFMIRIRITGGLLSITDLKTIIETARCNNCGYVHLTTRQDIQLHDVPAENIYKIVSELTARGLPVRGGGGDTYRNITACPHSGISPESIFDVQPYAKAANDLLMELDKAFLLPRKLKIGFSCCKAEHSMAAFQDLGFIADLTDDGEKGFTVYAGGGMGRESMPGIRIFDFMPEKDLLKCIRTVTELFHDHGDRTNRAKARLRYFVQKAGTVEFKRIFLEYFQKTAELAPAPVDIPAIKIIFEKSTVNKSSDFESWKKIALSNTGAGKDIFSIRLFIPNGNLSLQFLEEICKITADSGQLRISQNQDIYLPAAHEDSLPAIYEKLKKLNLTGDSFKGLITSCIGATVCKIGILDSTSIAKSIAEKLDSIFVKYPDKRAEYLPIILESIRISGCPNACSGHPVAVLGLQGMKKNIDGNLVPYLKVLVGGDVQHGKLAINPGGLEIPVERAPEYVGEIVAGFIESGSSDFREFALKHICLKGQSQR